MDFYAQNPADTLVAREIVGVVGDVREDAMSPASPTIYVSGEQTEMGGSSYVVRTKGDAERMVPLIADAAHAIEPRSMIITPRTLVRYCQASSDGRTWR